MPEGVEHGPEHGCDLGRRRVGNGPQVPLQRPQKLVVVPRLLRHLRTYPTAHHFMSHLYG